MGRPLRRYAVHGAVAGLLAGLVVALWFLAVDLAAGTPFETPGRLAAAFLDRAYAEPTTGLVVSYTFVHFGVLCVLGVATGLFMALADINPGPLVGMVLGLGVMSSLYYSALFVAEPGGLTLLPGYHVLGANLAAGLAYMGYMGRAAGRERPFGLEILAAPRLTRAVVIGLVGAAAVALWFLVLDVLRGQPLFTPAALGSALLGHAASAAGVEVTAGAVAFYTVVHIAAFCVTGYLFLAVAERVESEPGLWFLVVMAFIVLEAVFVPVAGLLGGWLMGALAWWAVVVGNLLAVASMTAWTLRVVPGLKESLADRVLPGPRREAGGTDGL